MTAEPNNETISVTFTFPAGAGAQTVALAGEFNAWSSVQHPMKRQSDDSHVITIELRVGRRYQYRYLVDGQEWENDWSADAYVPNEYGGNNSQIDLTAGSPRVAAAIIAPTPEPTATGSVDEPDQTSASERADASNRSAATRRSAAPKQTAAPTPTPPPSNGASDESTAKPKKPGRTKSTPVSNAERVPADDSF